MKLYCEKLAKVELSTEDHSEDFDVIKPKPLLESQEAPTRLDGCFQL